MLVAAKKTNFHIGLVSKIKFSRNKLTKIKHFIEVFEWWILDEPHSKKSNRLKMILVKQIIQMVLGHTTTVTKIQLSS